MVMCRNHLTDWMGDSIKLALGDSVKMVGIADTTSDSYEVPKASWDLYEMIQAFLQVVKLLSLSFTEGNHILDSCLAVFHTGRSTVLPTVEIVNACGMVTIPSPGCKVGPPWPCSGPLGHEAVSLNPARESEGVVLAPPAGPDSARPPEDL